ncbi:MAG: type II toxin-antitoxin system VapC family toxin [Bacteroidota bacterium]
MDTDWAIRWLRGNKAIGRLLADWHPDGLAVSIITLAELYEGVYAAKDRASHQAGLDQFLQGVTVLGVSKPIARLFAHHRVQLRRKNKLIGDLDLLIATTALHHSLAVLTNNRKHFDRVQGLTVVSA